MMTENITTAITLAAYGHYGDLAALILPLIFKNPQNIERIKYIAENRFGISREITTDTLNKLMELNHHEKTTINSFTTH